MQLFSVDCYLDKNFCSTFTYFWFSTKISLNTMFNKKNTLVRPRDVRIRQGDIRDPERAIM